MSLGIYISIPFCKSKCSYCNFASGVFSRDRMARYVERLSEDMAVAESVAADHGCLFERSVDSIYLGGGTPSTLPPDLLKQLFADLRSRFQVADSAEVTVECAPGTLTDEMLACLVECGVNRVSLGVQSFVDAEAKAVARLHDRAATIADIARLRKAGIESVNVDLIAGLPHQTVESWKYSVAEAIATGVPHVSIYMLEVDEDSRLGRELIAGGTRYHAHHVPDSDLIATMYEWAVGELNRAGIWQYEISNFARAGQESKHNVKYWTRQPYLGFGLDAHSFLPAISGNGGTRFASCDDLENYLKSSGQSFTEVSPAQALEEEFFLGLRLNRGISLAEISERAGQRLPDRLSSSADELKKDGFLSEADGRLRLTERGQLVSNDVFERFLITSVM